MNQKKIPAMLPEIEKLGMVSALIPFGKAKAGFNIMEIWKDIKGYEGIYKISNTGKVLSLHRNKIKKTSLSSGYELINLSRNGSVKMFSIHRLVGLVFIKNPLNKPEINHKNGIKIDNRFENLEWVTKSENHIHAYKIGLEKAYGENNKNAKLNSFQVRVIRKSKDLMAKELSEVFNISRKAIHDILRKRIWKKY